MTQNTVVGVFPSEMEAHQVAEHLKNEGFSERKIHLDEKAIPHPSWFARLMGAEEERDALTYHEALRRGRSLVAVDVESDATDDQLHQVAGIMERHNAIDVAEELPGEQRRGLSAPPVVPVTRTAPLAGTTRPAETAERIRTSKPVEAAESIAAKPVDAAKRVEKRVETAAPIDAAKRFDAAKRVDTAQAVDTAKPLDTAKPTGIGEHIKTEEERIPVVEETFGVTKRRVLKGGVRVYEHVEERPVEQEIRLTDERATVERRPVDRPITPEDEAKIHDQVIDVAETREEPVVSKTGRVVEEVVVSKETSERAEKVRETIRRTDVRVEPLTAEMRTESTAIPSDISGDFRKNFETQYPGRSYAEYEKAYSLGYRSALDARFHGKNFVDVEGQLKKELSPCFPERDWQQMRNAVHYGWERGIGKL